MDNQVNTKPSVQKKGLTRTQLGYLLTFIGAILIVCLCLIVVSVQFYIDEAERGITGSTFYYECDDYIQIVKFEIDGTMTSYKLESFISAPSDMCTSDWKIELALFKGAGAKTDCGLYLYDGETDTITLDGQVYTRFFG